MPAAARGLNLLESPQVFLRFGFILATLLCSHSVRGQPVISRQAAQALVARYVAADTSGQGLADSTDALLLPCEGDRATDEIEPVAKVAILSASGGRDSAHVTVEYRVLGEANSEDAVRAGATNWRFTKQVRAQIDTFVVVRDSTDQLRIVCGPYPGNHWGVSVMKLRATHMDARSRIAWSSALRESGILRP